MWANSLSSFSPSSSLSIIVCDEETKHTIKIIIPPSLPPSLPAFLSQFRSYESLRREHDGQIIRMAMEAGLRISPEQWSTLLYGNHKHKSDMQSIIDKVRMCVCKCVCACVHVCMVHVLV